MSKQLSCQKFIYKIHSSRLKKSGWKLTLPIDEAKNNDEVIALASSQILRWIDELKGVEDSDTKAKEIKAEIRHLKKEPNSIKNKKKIKQLYKELDEIQFVPEYMCLVIDKKSEYYRACKGFSINGMKYKRLLGTNGGIKNSTIVFVADSMVDELKRRISNGRNPDKEFVTAKLEAYQALVCSASNPVSMPHGIAVVNDCETKFMSDILFLTDENEGEPEITFKRNEEITMDASDGFGIMLPSLAARWSEELGLDYLMAGCNTRMSWLKGMMFTFDFLEFAEKVAGNYIVKDAWGNDFDVRDVEAIFTVSQVKLWDSYESCDEYIRNSLENKYTFSVTKTCPKELENERSLNYQFIQPLDFDDDDIEDLIKPTMTEIKEVLGGDWKKTILFLKGCGLNEKNIKNLPDDFIKAIMVDKRVLDDPYVQNNIFQLIKKRIDEAKIGVLKVHGNYSIVSGDPYALCQSMFGLEVTGLLKEGQIYNRYWADKGAGELICFRAPMSCINNILRMSCFDDANVRFWYQYMNECTVFNAWDTSSAALNGMDYDGDLVMITDNEVFIRKFEKQPALICFQRKADKCIPTEEVFVKSNIDSFGNDIGQVTNWITSMYEIRSRFDKDSEEYKTLSYRIRAGQQLQQNAIDAAKGIICKPMPRTWHDYHAVNKIEDEETKDFYKRIVAERKPYFMRYIYPQLKREYRTYEKKANRSAMCTFNLDIDELYTMPEEERTEEQKSFLAYYERFMPVGTGDCVMNKICRRFEQEFDGYISKNTTGRHFDYTILKSDSGYTRYRYDMIKQLYFDYNKKLQNFKIQVNYERIDEYDAYNSLIAMNEEFEKECSKICPDGEMLCNIILDLCYTHSATKKFAWSMCGKEIINNLLAKNGNRLSFPMIDASGDISYCGNNFSEVFVEVMEDETNVDNIE